MARDEIGIGGAPAKSAAVATSKPAARAFSSTVTSAAFGQLVAPSVAFLAPDDVGLMGMAHHDHGFDPWGQGDEAGSNRDPHPRSVSAG